MATKQEKLFNEEIERLLVVLKGLKPGTLQYEKVTKVLDTLCQTQVKTRWITGEVIAVCVANIGGLLLVLNYEHLHVIASSAFNNIMKVKL